MYNPRQGKPRIDRSLDGIWIYHYEATREQFYFPTREHAIDFSLTGRCPYGRERWWKVEDVHVDA